MRRLTRSFYARVFLMFVLSILAVFTLNQTLINLMGRYELSSILNERLESTTLGWRDDPMLPYDDEALKARLLDGMKSVHADEVRVFSTPLPLAQDANAKVNGNDNGKTGASDDMARTFPLPPALAHASIERLPAGEHFPLLERAVITADGVRWNAASVITRDRVVVSLVDTAATERRIEDFIEFRGRMIRKLMPLSLAVFILCALFMTRKVLEPIRRVQRSLSALDYRDLSVRLAVHGEANEFRAFIETFNIMLGKLERGFQQASRFSSDAAHELRTPLTIMQGHVERALIESEPGSRQQAQLRVVCDEIERLASITQKLLLLAQADAGRLAMDIETVDISALLEEMRADAAILEPPLEIRGKVEPGLLLQTDRALLQQMFNNLFTNAVKYNEPNGWIDISAWAEDGRLHVRFTNPTQPLPDGFESKVFDRFSRGDAAHSRRIDGTGLGLSLCREIAAANGGTLVFRVLYRTTVEVEFITALASGAATGISAGGRTREVAPLSTPNATLKASRDVTQDIAQDAAVADAPK